MTHTKRIDRNVLRKETSLVCYTSSVLRKSRHIKQKEKKRLLRRTEDVQHTKLVSLRNKLQSIRLVWVTVVALQKSPSIHLS